MKKRAFIFVGIVLSVLSSYAIFSNGFYHIERIEVKSYDRSTNVLVGEKSITDDAVVKEFKRILNRANRQNNTGYEMSRPEDYLITVLYENGNTDEFLVWNQVYVNLFLPRTTENDVFRIENERHIKEFLQVLD